MKTTALISFTFLAIAGCVIDPEVSEDQAAVTSCLGTSVLGGVDTSVPFPGSAKTADLSMYNPSTAPCLPGKWVVEVDGTANKAPTPYVQYAGLPLINTTCGSASVYGQVFGHLASGWVAVGGPDRAFGSWSWTQGCSLKLSFPQMTGYDRIAVAGVAYRDQAFDMANVTAGAQ